MTFTKDQMTQIKLALCEHITECAGQIGMANQADWPEAAAMWTKAYTATVEALKILNEEEA